MGRVLVTGASGFLGGAVLRRLGERGLGQGRQSGEVRWTLPDPAPELHDVEAIVHCAALSAPFGSWQAFQQTNVEGTRAVLNFARKADVKRFVFISSPSVYFALADQLNVAEGMPLPPPFNAYARSKVEAEALVRQASDLPSIILRPRGIYGPGDTALLPRLLRAAKRPLPRFRGGRARIDLTFVEDVVDAILLALDSKAMGQTLNISGGEVLPITQIVENACRQAGLIPRWRDMPLRPALLAARGIEAWARAWGRKEPAITRYGIGLFAFAQSLDISRAKEVLGWTPQVRFEKGLALTFARGGHETGFCQ